MNGLERREGKPPVPQDLDEYLNEEQKHTYHTMSGFGWRIYFLRRPLFQPPTVVMINHEGTRIAVLEQNGHFDMSPSIELRN